MITVANEKRGVKAGMRYGARSVLGCPFVSGREKGGKRIWSVVTQCDCGTVAVTTVNGLVVGNSNICRACQIRRANTTHGATVRTKPKREALYYTWHSMKDRCSRMENKGFARYGGRGIRVCDQWLESYESFRDWAIAAGWKQGLSIDRIDNDGNYEPSNCQWLTRGENSRKAHLGVKRKAVA